MTAVCPAGHTSSADDYCDVCGMPIAGGEQTSPPPPSDAPAFGPGGQGEVVPPGTNTAHDPAPTSGGQECPNCGTANAADALFCENCGYDFTTGSMPRPVDRPVDPPVEAVPATESTVMTSSIASSTPRPAPEAGAPEAGTSPEVAAVPAAETGTFEWVAELWIDPAWYEAQDSPDPLPSPGLPAVVPLRNRSLLIGRISRSRNIHPDIDCGTDSGVSRRQAQLTTDGTRWFVEDLDSANGTFVGTASGGLPENPIQVGVKTELDADDRVYVGAWTRLVIRQATEDEKAGAA